VLYTPLLVKREAERQAAVKNEKKRKAELEDGGEDDTEHATLRRRSSSGHRVRVSGSTMPVPSSLVRRSAAELPLTLHACMAALIGLA
jgi:hypothetical protein